MKTRVVQEANIIWAINLRMRQPCLVAPMGDKGGACRVFGG
jgi:hypothetical protein